MNDYYEMKVSKKLRKDIKNLRKRENQIYQKLEGQKQAKECKVNSLFDLLCCKLFAFVQYGKGSYVGEEEICMKKNRKFSLKAVTEVEGFQLSRLDFENILKEEFPYNFSKIKSDAEIKYRNYRSIISKLFSDIRTLAQRQNIYLSKNISFKFKNSIQDVSSVSNDPIKSQTLQEIYHATTQKNPIEEILTNVDVI